MGKKYRLWCEYSVDYGDVVDGRFSESAVSTCFLPIHILVVGKRARAIKTPTHMLIGFLAARILPGRDHRKSILVALGAGAPDLPLILVAAYCWIAAGFPLPSTPDIDGFVALVDQFYFGSEPFIAMHHLLHAPVSLLMIGVLCMGVARALGKSVMRACWFLAGAATHCIVDLFTHAGDGMLLFWPINWNYRFNSGVDQWDMRGAGALVLVIEISLIALFAGHLAFVRLRPFFSFLALPMDGTLRRPMWA